MHDFDGKKSNTYYFQNAVIITFKVMRPSLPMLDYHFMTYKSGGGRRRQRPSLVGKKFAQRARKMLIFKE